MFYFLGNFLHCAITVTKLQSVCIQYYVQCVFYVFHSPVHPQNNQQSTTDFQAPDSDIADEPGKIFPPLQRPKQMCESGTFSAHFSESAHFMGHYVCIQGSRRQTPHDLHSTFKPTDKGDFNMTTKC